MEKVLCILTFITYGLTSCNSKENKLVYNPKAVELNKRAAEFIQALKYDSALILLDEATKIDTTFYIAYANKITIYCDLKKFLKASMEAKNAIEARPDLAEGWVMAGMLKEKLGDSINALDHYKKSLQIFDERISDENQKMQLEQNKVNRALSLMLCGNEKEAKLELIRLKLTYPNDKLIDELLNTDKEKYMDKLFGNE